MGKEGGSWGRALHGEYDEVEYAIYGYSCRGCSVACLPDASI